MTNATCSVGECGRGGRLRRGWCAKHYQRFRTHGSPDVLLLRPRTGIRSCAKCLRTPDEVDFRKDKRAPDGLGAYCLPCAREYNNQIPSSKRDEYRASVRARHAENPEPRRARNRAWRLANPEKVGASRRKHVHTAASRARHRESNRRWRVENPGYFASWYEANKDDQREKARVWRSNNKDMIAAQWARRRLRMRGFNAEIAVIDRRAVWNRDGGICGLCAEPVAFDAMHLDHIKPVAKGGPHTFDNLQPTHPRCNHRKKDRELPKWAFAKRPSTTAHQ